MLIDIVVIGVIYLGLSVLVAWVFAKLFGSQKDDI